MAVKAQRGAREAIQHLSSILTDCAIPKVPSESFRQAKFNRNEATSLLWTLLLNVVQLLLFLKSRSRCEEIGLHSVRYHSLSPIPSDRNKSQVAALVVKKYLLSLGYPHTQFYLAPFGSLGSRDLLLAFGWLLHKSQLINKLFAYHLEMASATSIPFRANRAFAIRGIVQESDSFERELSETVSSLTQAAALKHKGEGKLQSSDTLGRVNEDLQKLAWLRGKLEANWRSSLNSQIAYIRLAHRLHKSTLTQSYTSEKSPHLNLHELFLLRFPDHLSSYLKTAEHHVMCLQRLVQWQLHKGVFWQWLESVFDLHKKEKAAHHDEQKQSGEMEGSAKVSSQTDEYQMESLETLRNKVQVLEKEVFGLVEKHRPYLEKVRRVWQLKAKTVDCEEVKREHGQTEMEIESLLLRSNQALQSELQKRKDATSTVETLIEVDRALYVGELMERGGERTMARSATTAFPTPLQQIQNASAKLLQDSRDFYGQILSELTQTQSFIQQQKADILRQLQAREQTLSTSICKVEI